MTSQTITSTKIVRNPHQTGVSPLFIIPVTPAANTFGTGFGVVLLSLTINTTTMKELRNKYFALKTQAMEMMKNGNINGYLAKLIEVNDVRLQLVQIKTAH